MAENSRIFKAESYLIASFLKDCGVESETINNNTFVVIQ